jgi:hypothetical protein
MYNLYVSTGDCGLLSIKMTFADILDKSLSRIKCHYDFDKFSARLRTCFQKGERRETSDDVRRLKLRTEQQSPSFATTAPAVPIDMVTGDDDDSSLDGAIARTLFRTGSDDDKDERFVDTNKNVDEDETTLSNDTYTERPVMDILLVERQEGSSIAE